MTNEEKKKLFKVLSAPFTDEAIERTDGRQTGRGYSMTGIKYQYVVARLNEVLGVGGYRTQQQTTVREFTRGSGRSAFDATCELDLQLGEWVDGKFIPFAEAHATGGHTATLEADARKGAYTNAFKKAAAMFGCGQQAYMGTLDDDNIPAEENESPPPATPQVQSRPQIQRVAPAQVQPTNDQRPPPPAQAEQSGGSSGRNRLTSKQLAAIWALARKLNYQQQEFRKMVKTNYGVQPEFLDRNAASAIIGDLSQRASNGHSHPTGEYGAVA